jgi:hypothetical protein
MKELISIAVLVATLYGGSLLGERIFQYVRKEALTKAASGLPRLSKFSQRLTDQKPGARPANRRKKKIK